MKTSAAQRTGIPARLDWLVRHRWGTPGDLAAAAQLSGARLSEIRTGRVPLGATVAARIAEASGASLVWLMLGTGHPPPSNRSDWFVTYTGRRLFLRDPDPRDIVIEDVAHGLANICRFGGQCIEFYSVAQHSVLVSLAVPSYCALAGLLHDATEAYLGDVIKPLKRELGASYGALEALWTEAVSKAFGVDFPIGEVDVHRADTVALCTERRDLLPPQAAAHAWQTEVDPSELWPARIRPSSPEVAEALFLARFSELQ